MDGIQNKGWFKCYIGLFQEDIGLNESVFLCYLINIFPILFEKIEEDSIEYKRISNEFIQTYFKVSRPTILKWFKKLEEQGYIKLTRRNHYNNTNRYYALNFEKINAVI